MKKITVKTVTSSQEFTRDGEIKTKRRKSDFSMTPSLFRLHGRLRRGKFIQEVRIVRQDEIEFGSCDRVFAPNGWWRNNRTYSATDPGSEEHQGIAFPTKAPTLLGAGRFDGQPIHVGMRQCEIERRGSGEFIAPVVFAASRADPGKLRQVISKSVPVTSPKHFRAFHAKEPILLSIDRSGSGVENRQVKFETDYFMFSGGIHICDAFSWARCSGGSPSQFIVEQRPQ
jgi:hypothetical protein